MAKAYTDIDPREVGARIKALREAAHLSQTQLGHAIDEKTAPGLVSRWESGNDLPSTRKIAKIANIFGVPTDSLLYGKGEGESVTESKAFRAWCESMAPRDLSDAEREFLAKLTWPGLGMPDLDWYDDALTMLRGIARKASRRVKRSSH